MDRKPPAKVMERRDPRCIRFKESEWVEIAATAKVAGLETSRFARECCLMGLRVHQAQMLSQSDSRMTA